MTFALSLGASQLCPPLCLVKQWPLSLPPEYPPGSVACFHPHVCLPREYTAHSNNLGFGNTPPRPPLSTSSPLHHFVHCCHSEFPKQSSHDLLTHSKSYGGTFRIHPLIHLLIHPSIHPSTHPLINPSTRPLTNPSIHPHIHLLIHLPIHPSTHPLTNPPIHSLANPSIHPSTHPLIPLSIHQPTHPSIHPLTNPSIHPLIHPHIHPSILPSIHQSTHPFIHPPPIHPPTHPTVRSEEADVDNVQVNGQVCEPIKFY